MLIRPLALVLAGLVGAQEIATPGVGGNSSFAYFVMVGPLDAARTYRPWLFSAVAMANRLRQLGSVADIVVLLAARRRVLHDAQITANEFIVHDDWSENATVNGIAAGLLIGRAPGTRVVEAL